MSPDVHDLAGAASQELSACPGEGLPPTAIGGGIGFADNDMRQYRNLRRFPCQGPFGEQATTPGGDVSRRGRQADAMKHQSSVRTTAPADAGPPSRSRAMRRT